MHQFAQISSPKWTDFLLTSPSPVIDKSSPETNKWVSQLAKVTNPSSLRMILLQQPIITYKSPTCLNTGTKLGFNHQIHRKQIIGTPASKSGKPLIAEDDYELTAVSRPKWTDSYL